MASRVHIEALYASTRQADAFQRLLRLIEYADNEIEMEAMIKYFRMMLNADVGEAKQKGLNRLAGVNGATRS